VLPKRPKCSFDVSESLHRETLAIYGTCLFPVGLFLRWDFESGVVEDVGVFRFRIA
jgi:hypothetical protein